MKKVIKSSIYTVEVSQENIFQRDFSTILKNLSLHLTSSCAFDTNQNSIETSIWLDSFNEVSKFSDNSTFDDTVCFLLAKDMNYQLVEDKEEEKIENISSTTKFMPKIPSHCVYFKSKNILLMEESDNSPNINTLKRGIQSNINSIKKGDINFNAIYREDIIERLNLFANKIKSIEIVDLNLEKYLEEKEDDGLLFNVLHHPDTKLNAKLQIESSDWRAKVVKLFENFFDNKTTRELKNIKISYKDENNNDDIIDLYNNLVYLKVEKENYLDDISILKNIERIEYSKNIYKTMIDAYNEHKNS